MGLVSLVRSTWALSYAALSITTLLLTGTAITGVPTKNRTVNVLLSIFNNQMSELPLTVILLDIALYFCLTITGTTRASAMVRFFNYVNVISAIGLLFLLKRSFEAKEAVEKFLGQLSKESKSRVELPGLTS
ncbi:hypothetical protein EDD21DRAFT_421799 [Dissophora ornata]|nr:hypothetical protein EDD21DRAFT_421799 [Dissophora ornata]